MKEADTLVHRVAMLQIARDLSEAFSRKPGVAKRLQKTWHRAACSPLTQRRESDRWCRLSDDVKALTELAPALAAELAKNNMAVADPLSVAQQLTSAIATSMVKAPVLSKS